ncbi:hypothetical protein CO675_31350 [Bradyrhizobium sp. C9]|nr:hypothetical protein CO675_31350 [Bradyrhizobium sp. C9]
MSGIAVCLLYLGAPASAAQINCGPSPGIKCLAVTVFSLGKKLPANDTLYRPHVAFAERELAPSDLKTALEYIISDNPDPSPWESIEWIAQAGRFGDALALARQRKSTVERLGGLLSVASHLLEAHDVAQAREIVAGVERELPSLAGDSDEYAGIIPVMVGELWAGLGQTDRTLRVVGGRGAGTVDQLLMIANKYPAAAGLREQAWREAERIGEPFPLRQLLQDAIDRGDPADIARAAQRAGKVVDRMTDHENASAVIALARALLTAGAPDPAARLVKPWRQWVDGKDAAAQFNAVNMLMPVLLRLGRDDEVRQAAEAVNDIRERARVLTTASAEYFKIGRPEVGRKLDADALTLALAVPGEQQKLRSSRDSVLHNLALARADHGDIQGALAIVDQLSNGAKVRDVTHWLVQRAISGHGAVMAPAIERLQQLAVTAHDPDLLLEAAEAWYAVGNESKAREDLAQVMKMGEGGQGQRSGGRSGRVAELVWHLDGMSKAETMVDIVDKLGVTDPGAIGRLVDVIRPLSSTVAVQLAARQTDVARQIEELANIAITMAQKSK